MPTAILIPGTSTGSASLTGGTPQLRLAISGSSDALFGTPPVELGYKIKIDGKSTGRVGYQANGGGGGGGGLPGEDGPGLSGNDPITIAGYLHGHFHLTYPGPDPDLAPNPELRSMESVVLTLPTPAMVHGRPTLPKYWARTVNASAAIEGPNHIRTVPNPHPANYGGGYVYPPPTISGVGDAHWTVDDLPDPEPYPGNFYWLGDPTAQDGTAAIAAGAQQWNANAGTPSAPPWRSFFPFKPSVRALDSFLPGGSIVHHPKGVHFNAHFIEHMWNDFRAAQRQPFTWVIVAMVVNYPQANFQHYLLDAGRNPDDVGFPRIGANDVGTPRTINDGLLYRTLIVATPSQLLMSTRNTPATGDLIRTRFDANIRPKMFFGVFNGAASLSGAWDTGQKRITKGTLDNTSDQSHRYYIIGRGKNRISQTAASHIMILEMRWWHSALTPAHLQEQYVQLSSTHHFDEYRAL